MNVLFESILFLVVMVIQTRSQTFLMYDPFTQTLLPLEIFGGRIIHSTKLVFEIFILILF